MRFWTLAGLFALAALSALRPGRKRPAPTESGGQASRRLCAASGHPAGRHSTIATEGLCPSEPTQPHEITLTEPVLRATANSSHAAVAPATPLSQPPLRMTALRVFRAVDPSRPSSVPFPAPWHRSITPTGKLSGESIGPRGAQTRRTQCQIFSGKKSLARCILCLTDRHIVKTRPRGLSTPKANSPPSARAGIAQRGSHDP